MRAHHTSSTARATGTAAPSSPSSAHSVGNEEEGSSSAKPSHVARHALACGTRHDRAWRMSCWVSMYAPSVSTCRSAHSSAMSAQCGSSPAPSTPLAHRLTTSCSVGSPASIPSVSSTAHTVHTRSTRLKSGATCASPVSAAPAHTHAIATARFVSPSEIITIAATAWIPCAVRLATGQNSTSASSIVCVRPRRPIYAMVCAQD